MATFTVTMTREQQATAEAAALHNAQINERYLRLKNAVDEQFEEVKAQAYAPQASVLAPERPLETVAPEQEFTHTRVESPLFTAETLDKLLYVDKARWAAEAEEITSYYAENFGDKMPKEIMENLEILKKNCAE